MLTPLQPGRDLRKLVLRERKDHRDGLQLSDHQQAGGIGGVHDVADIDQAQPNPPTDRRGHVRIHDLEFGAVNRSLITLDGAFKLPDLRPLGVDLLLGNNAFFVQKLKALVVHLHVAELRLILSQLPLGLLELNLEGARIDVDQVLALVDELAFLEVDLGDLAIDAAADGYRVEGGDGAKAVEIDGEIAALSGGNHHGHYEAACSRSLPTLPFASRGASGPSGALRLSAGARPTEIPDANSDDDG